MYAAALAEDPNAFEYDALYDSMQEQKVVPKQQERLARRPKYIASLLEQAEVRKKEQGITFERMLVSSCKNTAAVLHNLCTIIHSCSTDPAPRPWCLAHHVVDQSIAGSLV
jgi:hypothetical protein